ncbi:MAG TPA: hypothetical protein VHA52_07780 [Candidatus Babeliaceae bacterium]|nr:hypothetical protein [Candidatus Babeliaceae bacterium]
MDEKEEAILKEEEEKAAPVKGEKEWYSRVENLSFLSAVSGGMATVLAGSGMGMKLIPTSKFTLGATGLACFFAIISVAQLRFCYQKLEAITVPDFHYERFGRLEVKIAYLEHAIHVAYAVFREHSEKDAPKSAPKENRSTEVSSPPPAKDIHLESKTDAPLQKEKEASEASSADEDIDLDTKDADKNTEVSLPQLRAALLYFTEVQKGLVYLRTPS